jgi:hypothetical protein
MELPKSKSWAIDKNYYHHSNPSRPICVTMYEKCVVRKKVDIAWKIIRREIAGDKDKAWEVVRLYANDNAKMAGGRTVQDCAVMVLIDGASIDEAIRHGMSVLDQYEPRTWDGGKDERQLAVVRAEFADVLSNAIEGIKQAHAYYGLNRVEGESEIFANLPGLELPYSGFPDFSRRIELKTKWSGVADTKSGKRSAPLPQQPDWNHVCQVAGYWFGTGLMQTIVYARKTPTTKRKTPGADDAVGYRVFNESNSDKLSKDGLQGAINHIVAKCAIRENLLKSTNSVDEMLRLIEPDFGHMWAWDMRPAVLDEAKKLWGFK